MDVRSEDEACDIGSEMLLGSEFDVLEVWRGTTMIYRVIKVDRDSRSTAA